MHNFDTTDRLDPALRNDADRGRMSEMQEVYPLFWFSGSVPLSNTRALPTALALEPLSYQSVRYPLERSKFWQLPR